MASKNERELKVCALSGHNHEPVPSILLMGQWLEAAGFHIGDHILYFTFCFLPHTSNVRTELSIYCMIASSKRKEARA